MNDNLTQYSDAELYYLMQSDEKLKERVFSELYNRLSPRIYAYCRRFIGNKEEAEDIFQETFERFYQSKSKDREMTNVQAFVLRIARNLCVNFKRHETTGVSFEDYMFVRNEDRNEKDELLNLIKMALDLLEPDYREVFILREYEGLSYNEIADLTNSSLANVKVRIHRAKQQIREILSPYLADLEKF